MRIYHIAAASDWEQARHRGAYTTSTWGRTLDEVGYLHASRREQVAGTFRTWYADVDEPLVLLTIDTDRLDVPGARNRRVTTPSRTSSERCRPGRWWPSSLWTARVGRGPSGSSSSTR